MASEEGVPVDLYIYDLSHGLASILSPAIIGQQIEGVWHTSVVVFEREYFYGGGGVSSCTPGSTQLGAPQQVQRLGTTYVPFPVFNEYVEGLAASNYTGAAYQLLEHNCNHFSDEVAQFLCGARVPKHVAAQPAALPPPLRRALAALLARLQPDDDDQGQGQGRAGGVRHRRRDSPDFLTLNHQVEEARAASQALGARRSSLADKLARRQRRRDRRRRRAGDESDMAEAVEAVEAVDALEAGAARAGPSARGASPGASPDAERRARHPPIIYTDIDGAVEFEALTKALEGVALSEEERQSLDELRQYLVAGEGSWVLGDEFLTFVGRVLSDAGVPSAARVALLRALAAAARRDDAALLLHQDRRTHALLAHAHRVDDLPPPERLAAAQFVCNLFEHGAASEWPLYISEWALEGEARATSNLRATTRLCVHCVLSADAALRDAGTALLYNIAAKEVNTVMFDEACVELCMAALQLVAWAPPEEALWRALAALAALARRSRDVPQLVALVGPDPAAFRGTSARVDEQIDLILQTVAGAAS